MKKNTIIILASTFPRWKDDSVPRFVYDHAINMKSYFSKVIVIAPHYKNAKRKEKMEGIEVLRFMYFFPLSKQTIAYGKYKESSGFLSYIKAIIYVLVQLIYTLYVTIQYKADVINAHWMIPQGFSASIVGILTRKKVIVNIHGGDVFTLNHRIFMLFKKFVLSQASEVIVNSSVTKKAARKILDRKFLVIPEVVDVENFSQAFMLKNYRNYNKFIVLFVGRLSEEKGVIYLLEAIKLLVERNNLSLQLLIVGDGPEREKLEGFVFKNNIRKYVEFSGWKQREALVDIFRAANVFVGPSIKAKDGWVEAFGIVFAEASASGLPVITTDTGGMVDIIIDNETGFIIPEKSPAIIAEKIGILYHDSDLCHKFGEQGHKRAITEYSRETIKDMYKKLFYS